MEDQSRLISRRIQNEVEHGRKIAQHAEDTWGWGTPAGLCRVERRAQYFIGIGGLGPGQRVLEIGCGSGMFTKRIAQTGAQIIAIDISPHLLEQARTQTLSNVEFLLSNAESMEFSDGCFDVVLGSSVLHHVNVEKSLGEIKRVLRSGGRLVFTEPNILNPQVAFMFNVSWARGYFGVSPDEMAFSKWYIHKALRMSQFRHISVSPFDFLHPQIPRRLVSPVQRLGGLMERVPFVREIAGSLLISARA